MPFEFLLLDPLYLALGFTLLGVLLAVLVGVALGARRRRRAARRAHGLAAPVRRFGLAEAPVTPAAPARPGRAAPSFAPSFAPTFAPSEPPPAPAIPRVIESEAPPADRADAAPAPFTFALPVTDAVMRTVIARAGNVTIGVPAALVELVQQISAAELALAYERRVHVVADSTIAFHWAGSLLHTPAPGPRDAGGRHAVIVVRSGAHRVALHVDEVLGDRDVAVRNVAVPPASAPGLDGLSMLVSGPVALLWDAAAPVTRQSADAAVVAPPEASDVATTAGDAVQLPPSAPPATAVGTPSPLVLVVDDSVTVRRVAQRLLQREGYRVSLAVDGLDALTRLQEERPAVMLSDIEMPGMDGFDLARNVRADGALAGLPIIMITSRIGEKHREHARRLGVNDYLGKPYSEEELIRLVRQYARGPEDAAGAAVQPAAA